MFMEVVGLAFSCCVSLGFYVQAFFQNVILFAHQSITRLLENSKHWKSYLKLNKQVTAIVEVTE